MDETVQETLLVKIDNIMEAVNNQNMKEVKGLEDRLYGLEQLLFGARKIMQEQGDMAQVIYNTYHYFLLATTGRKNNT